MQMSAPRVSTTHLHFSSVPAMAITFLQPIIFLAIWTAMLPTAPAAPDMTTESLAVARAISLRP